MNFISLKNKVIKVTQKGLFKDASWMLIARLINVIVQAAYFVIVARALGAENYGSFVGVTSLASLLCFIYTILKVKVFQNKIVCKSELKVLLNM